MGLNSSLILEVIGYSGLDEPTVYQQYVCLVLNLISDFIALASAISSSHSGVSFLDTLSQYSQWTSWDAKHFKLAGSPFSQFSSASSALVSTVSQHQDLSFYSVSAISFRMWDQIVQLSSSPGKSFRPDTGQRHTESVLLQEKLEVLYLKRYLVH